MEVKFSILLFILTVFDIIYNYKGKELRQYHKVRLYSDIFTIASIVIPFISILLICFLGCLLLCKLIKNDHMQSCTHCLSIISSICVFNVSLGSLIIQIYSVYVYFVNDGGEKIKSRIIKVLMVLSIISIFIKLFFAVCNLISSLKNNSRSDSSENNEETGTELLEQNEV